MNPGVGQQTTAGCRLGQPKSSESESFLYDDGRLNSAAYDATERFGLRVVAGETAGYAHASEISEAAIARAGQSAALAKRGYEGVAAEGPRSTNAKFYGEENPLESPAFSDKVALLAGWSSLTGFCWQRSNRSGSSRRNRSGPVRSQDHR